MAVGAVTGLVATGANALGIDLGSTGKRILSFLGGGKEPNAGESSFIDAIDNYERISTSNARALLPEFTSRIAQGQPDYQLAQYLASQGGYTVNDVISSWKWKIVKRWIDKTRQIQESQMSQASSKGADLSQAGSSARMGSPFFVIILIIITVFYFQMQGK